MNPDALLKLKMLKSSMRCFIFGLLGFIPIIGVPFALTALGISRRVPAGWKSNFGNPRRTLPDRWCHLCRRQLGFVERASHYHPRLGIFAAFLAATGLRLSLTSWSTELQSPATGCRNNPHAGIPRTIVTLHQPAPIRGKRQQQPDRMTQRSGQMGHGSID